MAESLFNKVPDLYSETSLKYSLQHEHFSIKFAKFLRTPFLQDTSG